MAKQAIKKGPPKDRVGTNPLISSVVRQVVGANAGSQNIKESNEDLAKILLERLKNQGIKSITYRFPVEEIAEFDQMIMDLQKALSGKRVNKNDVIRSGVNTLLEDWKKNKKESVVFKLLKERVR